jgi:hypothetical protein
MTGVTSVQQTIKGDEGPPPSRSTGEGISGSVEVFFTARLTANKHATTTGSDLFASSDDLLA